MCPKTSDHLALCMINYNGELYLEESLASVLVQSEKFEEILLVDNASEDRGLEIVRDQFPAVKVIQLDRNEGPAAARNVGFRAAGCDRIMFVDNDVTLGPDCADLLRRALDQNPRAAVVMPRVLYGRRRDTIQFDGADSHFLGLMALQNVNQPIEASTETTRTIGSVVTACFLIDRKRWGAQDPFDDSFFFNYEDHDFGLRTRALGHEILSVPAARCFHGEGTEGLSLRESGSYPRRRVYYLIRNRWQLVMKTYETKTLILLSPILLTYEIFQLAGVIKNRWLGEWLKAATWIVLHSAEILKKRQAVQKARVTPDREILTGGAIPFRADLTKSPVERMARSLLDHLASLYWKKVQNLL